ncbi:hypothetical protein J1N35_045023, partial [Gossypium stocksii]
FMYPSRTHFIHLSVPSRTHLLYIFVPSHSHIIHISVLFRTPIHIFVPYCTHIIHILYYLINISYTFLLSFTIGTISRQKQNFTHTAGSKSFACTVDNE